jgi:hypothetical protein
MTSLLLFFGGLLAALSALAPALAWRRGRCRGPIALAAGVVLLGGLIGVLFSLVLIVAQGIDGGTLSASQRTVYLGLLACSTTAIVGGGSLLSNPKLGVKILVAASVGIVALLFNWPYR